MPLKHFCQALLYTGLVFLTMACSSPAGVPPRSSAIGVQAYQTTLLQVAGASSWRADAVAGRAEEADFADGEALSAAFAYPWALASHPSLGLLIVDRFNHRLRSLQASSVSTLAGQREPGLSDGTGAEARLNNPQGLAVARSGEIYLADSGSGSIRRVSASGEVSTLLSGLQSPSAVAIGPAGQLYIAEAGRHRILQWDFKQATPSVLAGSGEPGRQDGPAETARFFTPLALSVGQNGEIFVADGGPYSIRRISASGEVSTLAGGEQAGFSDGMGPAARFQEPSSLAQDHNGNLLVVDRNNRKIRHITPEGLVSTLQISPEPQQPQALSLSDQSIWLSDTRRHQIWRLSPVS